MRLGLHGIFRPRPAVSINPTTRHKFECSGNVHFGLLESPRRDSLFELQLAGRCRLKHRVPRGYYVIERVPIFAVIAITDSGHYCDYRPPPDLTKRQHGKKNLASLADAQQRNRAGCHQGVINKTRREQSRLFFVRPIRRSRVAGRTRWGFRPDCCPGIECDDGQRP